MPASTYLWQSPDWPNFRYDLPAVHAAVVAARLAQGRLEGVAQALGLADAALVQLRGWADEAQATAAIEGEQLALQSVRASAARRLGLSEPPTKEDPRVEATLDVLQAVLHPSATLDDATLLAWHAALFPTGRSGAQAITVGAYRTHAEPMQIVTPRLGKNDLVHFEAPPSSAVPTQMAQLLAWLNHGTSPNVHLDALSKAAIAHLWFETIHPFEDGNGRIGRALSEWVIAQDQGQMRLFSLSQQLWLHRKDYYAQLQAATTRTDMDVTGWVLWFVQRIEAACNASLAQVQSAIQKTEFWHATHAAMPTLNASQRKVLNTLFEAQPDGFSNGLPPNSTPKSVKFPAPRRIANLRP